MKKWKYPDFHTDWFPSLRMWYYFRLCFSFSCSGYKFTVIKKAKHFAFCFTRSLLATVVGPCTTLKQQIWEKLYTLFTSKIFSVFRNFKTFNNFSSRKRWRIGQEGGGLMPSPAPTPVSRAMSGRVAKGSMLKFSVALG